MDQLDQVRQALLKIAGDKLRRIIERLQVPPQVVSEKLE